MMLTTPTTMLMMMMKDTVKTTGLFSLEPNMHRSQHCGKFSTVHSLVG